MNSSDVVYVGKQGKPGKLLDSRLVFLNKPLKWVFVNVRGLVPVISTTEKYNSIFVQSYAESSFCYILNMKIFFKINERQLAPLTLGNLILHERNWISRMLDRVPPCPTCSRFLLPATSLLSTAFFLNLYSHLAAARRGKVWEASSVVLWTLLANSISSTSAMVRAKLNSFCMKSCSLLHGWPLWLYSQLLQSVTLCH